MRVRDAAIGAAVGIVVASVMIAGVRKATGGRVELNPSADNNAIADIVDRILRGLRLIGPHDTLGTAIGDKLHPFDPNAPAPETDSSVAPQLGDLRGRRFLI